MKTRFTSDEIAHVWANASAPHGKSPGAMSFEGDIFYSYNTAIARRITHKGETAIVVNDRHFSNSTVKHQSHVRRALVGQPFHFSAGMNTRLDVTGEELFAYALEQAAEQKALADKARTRKDAHLGRSGEWLEEARRVSEFFGLRKKVDSASIDRLAAARARAEKQQQKARAKLQKEREEKARELLALWLAGDPEVQTYSLYELPTQFRIEGEELVSTRGARVPLADAERAIRFALARREKGWRENGETCPVGGYRLNSITADGVVAGCHRIAWPEVERLSALLQPVIA
jgi:hypothetical protein